jgi:hypothetical protein
MCNKPWLLAVLNDTASGYDTEASSGGTSDCEKKLTLT